MNKTLSVKLIFLLVLVLITNDFCFAQKDFTILNGSKTYSARISVAKFINNDCSGPGIITLYDKSLNNIFQILKSDNLCFYAENDANPTVNVIELYGEQSPLIFDDFNFDGNEDLAISNGYNGSYGGPSYDVYLFNKTIKQFEISSELTEIASSNLGMFRTDQSRKRLITFNKSGCCWHITTEYVFASGKDLVKVYELVEDATDGSDYVTVTERKFENRVWYVDVKKLKIEEYYKDK